MSLEEIQASPLLKEMSKTSGALRRLDLQNSYGIKKEHEMTRAQRFHDAFCRFNAQAVKKPGALHKMFKAWRQISRDNVKVNEKGLELWTFHDNSQVHVKDYGRHDLTPHVSLIR